AMLIAVAAVLAPHRPAFAQQGGTARYFYDDNGRLKTVLSPTGEAAIYSYDPAGKFTAITRRAATRLSIIDFPPQSRPARTTLDHRFRAEIRTGRYDCHHLRHGIRRDGIGKYGEIQWRDGRGQLRDEKPTGRNRAGRRDDRNHQRDDVERHRDQPGPI